MPHSNFTVESLARYLHLAPSQVARLADRGSLPGRKVAGEWRFARADIHHWMERRIGVLDEQELVHVEGALERSGGSGGAEPISVAALLKIDAIAVPLNARTRNSVIHAMAALAAETGLLWDEGAMAQAVRAREDLQPTALDNGVALLHPRRPMPQILAESFLALGRTSRGIPFGGSRGTLTDLFFLICSTDDRSHLRILARIARLLGDSGFLAALRAAESAEELHRLIRQREEKLVE
jgi:PTS system nitrogen regulatory IIA component